MAIHELLKNRMTRDKSLLWKTLDIHEHKKIE